MTPLVEFLDELADNPSSLEKYKTDPKGYVSQSKLTLEEQGAILSGDLKRVRGLLPKDLSTMAATIIIAIVIVT